MILVRVVTVLGIVLSIVAILIQNQNPMLALMFLGMRSQPLPLGLWVAGAVLVGALVSLGILAILSFGPTPASVSSRSSRRRGSFRWPQFNRPQSKQRDRSSKRQPQGYSDWDEAPATDWYGEPTSRRPEPFFDDEPEYEDDPVDGDYPYDDPTPPWAKKDSSYSYSSRDADFAGQRESVFDAEYRVLNPPQKPVSTQDDWNDFEDEFTEN